MRQLYSAVLLASAAWLAGAQIAGAQTPAEAVKQRQDIMEGLWPKYFRPLVAVARGESTDASQVGTLAAGAARDLKRFGELFPAGTGPDAVKTTRAKAEVWSDRAEFDAKLRDLIDQIEQVAQVSREGNLDAIKAQIGRAGQACGGCHSGRPKEGGKFRSEEKT